MKKFLLCLLAVLMNVPAVSAQVSTYADFKREIAAANAECPLDLTPLGYVASVELSDNPRRLFFTVMITNEMITYELLSAQKQVLKNNVSQIMSADNMMKIMIKPCIQHKVTFCFRYQWPDGRKFDITFSPSELNAIYNTEADPSQTAYNLVEQMIANESAQCPIKVDEGMIEQSVYRFEENIYYEISIDEEMFDMSTWNANQSQIRRYLEGRLGTPGLRIMITNVANCGYNIVYLFVGDKSGRTCEVKFTNEDLKQILQ